MTRRAAPTFVVLAACLVSCELSPRLYLSVRAETGSSVRRVQIQVYSPEGAPTPLPDGTFERALATGQTLDLRVMARVGGERVRVLVDGFDGVGGTPSVHQDWVASLPTEGAGYLQLVLWNRCLQREPCPARQSCAADGTCVSNDVGPARVFAMDGGALGACRGGDASACSARPDGGPGSDGGGIDATVVDRLAPLDMVPGDVVTTRDLPSGDRIDAGIDGGPMIDRPDAATDVAIDRGGVPDVVDVPGIVDARTDVVVDAGRCPGPSATPQAGWTNCGSVWCPTLCNGPAACAHVRALALGRDHGCAIRPDGPTICWGSSGIGALGNGPSDGGVHAVPVTVVRPSGVPLMGVQAIYAGFNANFAVDTAGDLTGWGAPGGDPLGLEFNPSFEARPAIRLQRADAGVEDNRYSLAASAPDETCVVTRRGAVRCRTRLEFVADGTATLHGDPATYPVRDVQREDGGALGDISALGLGYLHGCALRRDRSVWCWGANRVAQLGRPLFGSAGGLGVSILARRVPGVEGATALGVGDFFNCAVVGTDVRCWGLAAYGRVGNTEGNVACAESNGCAVAPVSVANLNELVGVHGAPTHLAVAAEHSCVLLADGGVWCWGFNALGELGLPTTGAGMVVDRASVGGLPAFTGADDLLAGGSGGGEDRSWTCAHRAADCTWWCWGRIPGELPRPTEAWRPRVLRWAP